MIRRSLLGRFLGHLCGLVGTTIAIDTILGIFDASYVQLFPYGDVGIVIAAFMIVLGARVVSENLPRRFKGPWRR